MISANLANLTAVTTNQVTVTAPLVQPSLESDLAGKSLSGRVIRYQITLQKSDSASKIDAKSLLPLPNHSPVIAKSQ